MAANVSVEPGAEQNSVIYVPNVSVPPPEDQESSSHHCFSHCTIQFEEIRNNTDNKTLNIKNQITIPSTKLIEKE